MIRICAWCKLKIGEKEPFQDKSETHGICGCCLIKRKVEMGRSINFPSLREVLGL